MEEVGYFFDMQFVLYEVGKVYQEILFCLYSERFVIVYGFISSFFGIFIWIFKNLWICGDCYIVFKFIFKLVG